MKLKDMKRKMYKLFVILMVSISMSTSGWLAQKEISEMLKSLTGEKNAIIKELEEQEDETGDPELLKKRQSGKRESRNKN